jgi:hypothetical protein
MAKAKNQTKTAVSYYRLATAEQNGKDARLARYKKFVQEKANALGAEITAEFEDIGVPYNIDKQLGLQRLIKHLKKTPVDYVIVPNFAMIAKDVPILAEFKDQVEKLGVKLVTPSGEENAILTYLIAHSTAQALLNNETSAYYEDCRICHESMEPGQGCLISTVCCNGRYYDRIKFGSESNPAAGTHELCEDCNVKRGQYHHWYCKLDECPFCDAPIVNCDCDVYVLMKR